MSFRILRRARRYQIIPSPFVGPFQASMYMRTLHIPCMSIMRPVFSTPPIREQKKHTKWKENQKKNSCFETALPAHLFSPLPLFPHQTHNGFTQGQLESSDSV